MSSEDPGTREICVFCRKRQAVLGWRPFCSERCRLQDLARWTDGSYRVAGDDRPETTTEDQTPEHSFRIDDTYA
jgi:endogenous inhibitor of DNA gyrase (YacG/DUF329 family)